MRDLNRALTDISVIREQLARGREFRGYGPTALAMTGALALTVAAAQALWLGDPTHQVQRYLSWWVITAAVSFAIIVVEAIRRSRRAHGSLALPMLQAAVEQFLPAIVVGGLLPVVLQQVAPQNLWMMPGLWQIVFSMGVFASCRFLPRPMFIVGVWYLAFGLCCLAFAGPDRSLSPWAMGIPFGVGQILVAAILKRARTVEAANER